MNLFDKLPHHLFGFLSGRNNKRAWDLLVHLYTQCFGPESVPDFPEGFLKENVLREIESFLVNAAWEIEEPAGIDTTYSQLANQLFRRLTDTGWMIEERSGLRSYVNMRTQISQLIELLQNFLEEGPRLVSGDVQLIFNQLVAVKADPRNQISGFTSAAKLCIRLINALNSVSVRVKDLMDQLTNESETSDFVRRFFDEHIGQLYVRDFKSLRTVNHPLRLRFEIIKMVDELEHDPILRAALLQGYIDIQLLNSQTAEQCLELDVKKFRRLLDVEKFITRMDQVMNGATQRAVASIQYRIKPSDRIEIVVADTVKAVIKAKLNNWPIEGKLFATEQIIGDDALRNFRAARTRLKRKILVKRVLSLEERATILLRKAMLVNRDASDGAIRRYIIEHIAPGKMLSSDDLPVKQVKDAVAFLALTRLALIATHNPKMYAKRLLFQELNLEIELVKDERSISIYFDSPKFVIRRRENDAA